MGRGSERAVCVLVRRRLKITAFRAGPQAEDPEESPVTDSGQQAVSSLLEDLRRIGVQLEHEADIVPEHLPAPED